MDKMLIERHINRIGLPAPVEKVMETTRRRRWSRRTTVFPL